MNMHDYIVEQINTRPELQQLLPDHAAIATELSGRKIVQFGNITTTRGAAALFPSLNGLPRALSFQLALRKLIGFATAAKQSQQLDVSLLGEAVSLQLEGFQTQGLDFAEPELRNMLDYLVSLNALSQDESNGFKSIAEQIEVITVFEVASALEGTQWH